ncbi:hypothetical protein B7494_g6225 [Chlorociboria aeruginascens]|nr:hypothetical protein B7494_g6225 [Chlorociboria aeruginascens]
MAQPPQLFGIVPTGHPPIIQPTSVPSQTSFIYTISRTPARSFSHLVVFLLPGVSLPPNTAAAVYLALPSSQFKFLGGIGPGKESAVFKINGLLGNAAAGNSSWEVDMDAPEGISPTMTSDITLGISIEAADAVAAQMAAVPSPMSAVDHSSAMVLAPRATGGTLVLAQRIIKNAFNFLASFSGNVNGGVEVVPLKAFEEWWKKFEGKIKVDPGFLEKDGD